MTIFPKWVENKWTDFSWNNNKKAPIGEALRSSEVPELDYSGLKEKQISTTIDCYVTGTYLTDNGKIFTIRQRYSVPIKYSNSTIIEAMQRAKSSIVEKFQNENDAFNITDVFIPELKPDMNTYAPMYMYSGGKLWRMQTRVEMGRFKLGVHKDIYKSNAQRLIKQYGIKRKEALIRKL